MIFQEFVNENFAFWSKINGHSLTITQLNIPKTSNFVSQSIKNAET